MYLCSCSHKSIMNVMKCLKFIRIKLDKVLDIGFLLIAVFPIDDNG